jgi:heat-inducible transcriptional repressor
MSPDPSNEVLPERAQRLLHALVQSYIRDGLPVGSRSLSREAGMTLSSATVRNVMADLEELGFVTSPHTSAGRVPTDRAYRFFVDTLLRAQMPAPGAMESAELRQHIGNAGDDSRSLVANASQLLSNITHLAGVVTIPLPQAHTLTQLEFLPLSERRLLVVLVYDNREVQNRIIELPRNYGADELRHAAALLNSTCRGLTLPELRQELFRQLKESQESLNRLLLDAVSVAQMAVDPQHDAADVDYVIAGETNLMGLAELGNVDKLKRLFEAFNERRDLLQLLDASLRAEGVQIFIGHESGYRVLDDCSIVAAPYITDDGVAGVLGVIGPTRMAYDRVIPIVDLTAKLLGSALNSRR